MIFDKYQEIIFSVSKISDGNMSFLQGDPKEALENRRKFLAKSGISLQKIVTLQLQHGTETIQAKRVHLGQGALDIESAPKTDGLITDEPEVFLFLTVADCLPILFYDPIKKSVGLIHSGWRGLDLGIISCAIKKIGLDFGSKPEDILAYIGPSIGPCCYKDFPDIQQRNDPKWQPYLSHEPNGTYGLDLWSFAEQQLKDAGLQHKNIENSKICTAHSNEYFSHRKAQLEKLPQDYRIAVVLGMRQPVK